MLIKKLSVTLAALALPLSVACSSSTPDPGDCAGGKCDELEGETDPLDSPCGDALFDRSGRGFLPERLANDAFIKHVYMDSDDGCPVTPAEVMAVLNQNDDEDCGPMDGIKSSVVSEQAQLAGVSDGASYRTVTTRTCDGRPNFSLIFSMFGFADVPQLEAAGLHPEGDKFPGGLEVISFDEENQVFNFYKEINGKMGFFGSSTDYVMQGPGGPNLTSVRGCANCHPGGGLRMKELEVPWVHWEEVRDAGFTDFERRSPGADELFEDREAVLGARADGPRLEQEVIKPGNEAWNERRIQFVNGNGTVEDLLKPLFCPTTIQIGSTFNKRRVNHDFLVDKSLLGSLGLNEGGRINVEEDTYDNMLEVTGSTVPGTAEADLNVPMAFMQRAHIDMDYIEKLIEADLIDREFADDVLMVDFTRQVLSNDRCDLLDFAPDLDTEDRDADAIRDGFIENLSGADADSPEGQLLAHLEATVANESFDHSSTVESFLDSCDDRNDNDQFASSDSDFESLLGASEFHMDALKLRSLGRKVTMEDGILDSSNGAAERTFKVFEFADTMPVDDISVSTSAAPGNPMAVHRRARFSPIDCNLVDEHVQVESSGSGPAPSNACPGDCGEFVNGADCQCDSGCAEFGNCCEGFEPLIEECPGEPGEFVNGADCQCDPQCAEFGNCCEGFEQVCL